MQVILFAAALWSLVPFTVLGLTTQQLARSHGMLPGVWGICFGFVVWGFFCFLFSQKLQVMVCAPSLWSDAVCESRVVKCRSVPVVLHVG